MGLTGKYDFPGIKKAGVKGITLLLAGTSWGAALVAGPFKFVYDFLLELLINFLANKGLMVIDIGVFYVGGKFDQGSFDKAMNEGLERVKSGKVLTPAQIKEIDQNVIDAFREFGKVTRYNTDTFNPN